jgi:hypothetical protein
MPDLKPRTVAVMQAVGGAILGVVTSVISSVATGYRTWLIYPF